MVQMDIEYLGDLRCKAVHGPSGCELLTDAPEDNHGKGESFSPTDLVVTALATCVVTIMGIVADKHGIDLRGLRVSAKKEMATAPVRRIAKATLELVFPNKLDEADLKRLKAAVDSCPVKKSLLPDVEVVTSFSFGG